MKRLPTGIEQTFLIAAGELGLGTASRMFVRTVATEGGRPLVEELRDHLGRRFPVLDVVASEWLAQPEREHAVPDTDLATQMTVLQRGAHAVADACALANRVLIVGIEAEFLDELLPRLPDARIFLLTHRIFDVDWDRVLANFGGRVEPTSLADFQQHAGRHSVLLTFTYGSGSHSTYVAPAWMRLIGPDVRSQFRSLLGWEVLGAPFRVYPRWLVEVPLQEFTQVIAV